MEMGQPKIAQLRPEIAQRKSTMSRRQPAERKIYRRERTRKRRTLNDGGKLEIVRAKISSNSDYVNMLPRPKGRERSNNERGRRARTEDILECEGCRLDP